METAETILEFWYGETNVEVLNFDKRPLWFQKDTEFDKVVKTRFEDIVIRAGNGELHGWSEEAPASALALVLLLDQFPRNIYRGSGQSFAFDSQALQVAATMIEKGWDRTVAMAGRFFIYLCYVHSEDRNIQEKALELAEKMIELAPADQQDRALSYRESVKKHYVVIERFGRYPHRNALLGRLSSPEELAFLATNPGF